MRKFARGEQFSPGQKVYLVEYDLPPKNKKSLHEFYQTIREPEYLGENVSRRTSTTSVIPIPIESLELALKIKALAIECNGKSKVWHAELIEQ